MFEDAEEFLVLSAPFPPGASPEPAAKIMFGEFMLEGQWFTAMDSGHMHKFGFNEAIARVTKAFLQMKKFDLAKLQKAYEG